MFDAAMLREGVSVSDIAEMVKRDKAGATGLGNGRTSGRMPAVWSAEAWARDSGILPTPDRRWAAGMRG